MPAIIEDDLESQRIETDGARVEMNHKKLREKDIKCGAPRHGHESDCPPERRRTDDLCIWRQRQEHRDDDDDATTFKRSRQEGLTIYMS